MSQIHTRNLPLTHKKYLHQDFLDNESDYWKRRDQLLQRYYGQWVAIHGGQVVAHGNDLLDVLDGVGKLGCHAYVACVGQEDSVIFTIRRIVQRCRGAREQRCSPLPRSSAPGLPCSRAHWALPEDDCLAIDLFSSPYLMSLARGVLGPSVSTLVYRGNVEINGTFYRSLIQPIPGGRERILGRDVLNQVKVTFDGPRRKVIFHS